MKRHGCNRKDIFLKGILPACVLVFLLLALRVEKANSGPPLNSTAANSQSRNSSKAAHGSGPTGAPALCTDCHNAALTIASVPLGRTLHRFDFENEMHGKRPADYCGAVYTDQQGQQVTLSFLKPPYRPQNPPGCGSPQPVLSCTDCHEPNGSPNNFLIRQEVNGNAYTNAFNPSYDNKPVSITQYGAGSFAKEQSAGARPNLEWASLCNKCHANIPDAHHLSNFCNAGVPSGTTTCFGPDSDGTKCLYCHPKLTEYRVCSDCHFHGNRKIPGNGSGLVEFDYGKPLF